MSMYYIGQLHAVDCRAAHVPLQKSPLSHKDGGQRLFGEQPFGATEIVGT